MFEPPHEIKPAEFVLDERIMNVKLFSMAGPQALDTDPLVAEADIDITSLMTAGRIVDGARQAEFELEQKDIKTHNMNVLVRIKVCQFTV